MPFAESSSCEIQQKWGHCTELVNANERWNQKLRTTGALEFFHFFEPLNPNEITLHYHMDQFAIRLGSTGYTVLRQDCRRG